MKMPEIKLLTKVINAVLDIEATEIENELDGSFDPCICIHYNGIHYIDGEEFDGGVLLLNIYEFIALCKKWITKQNIELSIKYKINSISEELNNVSCKLFTTQYHEAIFCDTAKTEIKAVLKAC